MYSQEEIYESMMGELVVSVPGIDNAFDEGRLCALLYERIYDANQRLCGRLGVEEDTDVEEIISCFFDINRELCRLMYQYGRQSNGHETKSYE